MSAPRPAWKSARSDRWARPTSRFFLALVGLALLGLALGSTGDEHHGFVHAQPWDKDHLWAPLALLSALAALTAWRRWRAVTIVVALLSLPVLLLCLLVGSIPMGVARSDAVVSPTGRWAFRVDDRGFQERYYAPIMLERGSLGARYWQVGAPFSPGDISGQEEDFTAPRWTSDDTVEIRSNRRVWTYRMTPDGPATVSTVR